MKVKVDRTGIFAVFCDHGICLLAVMMTAGENWRYATMLQRRLLEGNIVLATLFYDINCRYGPHFMRWLERQHDLDPVVLAAARKMQTPLPPFHVSMHSKECQRQCSLLLGDFSAWLQPLGEAAERFWSELGRAARTKYMTLHNHKLTLECTIAHINEARRDGCAATLEQRVRTLHKTAEVGRQQLELLRGHSTEV